MTIHANGRQNSGLLALGQLGDTLKQELKGINLERKVDEIILSNDQVSSTVVYNTSPEFTKHRC